MYYSISLKKYTVVNYIGQFYIILLYYYLEYLGTKAFQFVVFITLLVSWIVLLDFRLFDLLYQGISISFENKVWLNVYGIVLNSYEE